MPKGHRHIKHHALHIATRWAHLHHRYYGGKHHSATAANAFGWYQCAVPAYSSVQYNGYQILNINESLLAVGSAAGLTTTISGLERV